MDLDIFARSLSGDRRARIELFKKHVHASSRVRKFGADYPDLDEFLHDCFRNLICTGHAWDKEGRLSEWVESVALWTALQHERSRDMAAHSASGEIRICAEFEGDEGPRNVQLKSYAPPAVGLSASPSAWLEAILDQPERTVFILRAIDGARWEEIAARTGKPVRTIGPAFSRAVARLARVFGAPPPIGDDFVPVFERAARNPLQPEGRAVSVHLDNSCYESTPELQEIGITTAVDARSTLLWDSAGKQDARLLDHLHHCSYCEELQAALARVRRALSSGPDSPIQLCPGAFTLFDSGMERRETVDEHVLGCSRCREERARLGGGEAAQPVVESNPGAGKKVAIVCGILVLLGSAGFGGFYYFQERKTAAAAIPAAADPAPEQTTVLPDRRYADLASALQYKREDILPMIKPESRAEADRVLVHMATRNLEAALKTSAPLATQKPDPGVLMLYSMALFEMRQLSGAYRQMLASEAMPPRLPFRCWAMFNLALAVADRTVIDREAEHLAGDPTYGVAVAATMKKVRAR
jgi:DNA-directed RNA polymerase specialized sigma24 family protein